MKIFIDAGHNYSTIGTGAVGNGLKEQDVTFYIAEKLKKLLIAFGHEVKMSRNKLTDNIGKTVAEGLRKRASMSNDWGADLFVSIHCNAFNTLARGTEVLVYSEKSKSFETAQRIQDAIVSKLGTKDRGVKERPDLAVLRHTKAPAILVETAFIDNSLDAKFLKNRQDDFAKAIFEGIVGIREYDKPDDIVFELAKRGLVYDVDGMINEMKQHPDGRLYHLARKTLTYIRGVEK